jgi:diguanylate cyclase (GGDEF)-like protein
MSDKEYSKKYTKLEALRAAFAAALPGRLGAITACWRLIEAANTRNDAHAELTILAHSLAGSAGSFGFRRLGEKAKELEEALAQLYSTTSGLPLCQQNKQISGLIDALSHLALDRPDTGEEVSFDVTSADKKADTMSTNYRIILIEDDALLAQDIATQLRMFGWEVSVFANATDAFIAMQDPWPAAVIIDLMLPEGPMAGLDLMQQVQSDAEVTVPHVVITTCNDWETRLAAVRSGAAAYLVKPIDISALEDRLDRITNRNFQEPYRVLIVDDDEMLAEHYVQILTAAGMSAIAITSPDRLLTVMDEYRPEIVLMDLYMPECSGVEALKVIRQDPQFDSLPVVFLSTESCLALHQNAMQIGAEDFLQKPISEANLIMAVSIRAERFRAITALIRQDSLTGLLNHISFKLRLEAEVDRSRRSNAPVSLAMLDIDYFKKVNDTYGHPQGDRVIKSLAQLLRKRLRKLDIIGRYGGEEFIIAMPNTLPSQALKILDELRESFGKLRFETTEGEFVCTFSCGVSAMPPLDNAINLINLADDALYRAKRSGRNRIEVFIRADQLV